MNSIGSENTTTKSVGVEGVTQTPPFDRHSGAAAAVGESSFKPRPPKITVNEDRPAGRHPPSKSGLCLWDATFSDPASTTSVLPERRHSYQMPVSTADNQEEAEEEDSRDPQRPSSSSSVCCYRRRKSRTEEPYVFALSQAVGRRTLDHRRGSAPAVGSSVTTATSPERKKSEFQEKHREQAKSPLSFPEKQHQQQRTGKPVKHHSTRSSDPPPVESSCVEGYATGVVEDRSPPRAATHSRWSTRALSLPASEYLALPPSRSAGATGGDPVVGLLLLLPREGVTREEEEEGETGGSRRPSSSSLLVCPPEDAPFRRRSVSHLEAISEEPGGGGGAGGGQKTTVRRYSIPSRPPNDP